MSITVKEFLSMYDGSTLIIVKDGKEVFLNRNNDSELGKYKDDIIETFGINHSIPLYGPVLRITVKSNSCDYLVNENCFEISESDWKYNNEKEIYSVAIYHEKINPSSNVLIHPNSCDDIFFGKNEDGRVILFSNISYTCDIIVTQAISDDEYLNSFYIDVYDSKVYSPCRDSEGNFMYNTSMRISPP